MNKDTPKKRIEKLLLSNMILGMSLKLAEKRAEILANGGGENYLKFKYTKAPYS